MEAKHVTLPELVCQFCSKSSKTRHSLRVHMKQKHDIVMNIENYSQYSTQTQDFH